MKCGPLVPVGKFIGDAEIIVAVCSVTGLGLGEVVGSDLM